MTCEDLFLKQLHERGYRLTPQREMVLLVLHQIGHPANAEEIFAQVALRSASVEISTVYRTLDLLHNMHMVSIIDPGDKQRLYVLAVDEDPHMHVACRVCGKISGIAPAALQPLLDHIQNDLQYRIDISSLTISGICAGCETAANTEKTAGRESTAGCESTADSKTTIPG